MRGFGLSVLAVAALPLAGCGTIGDAWNGLWGRGGSSDAVPYRAKLSRGAEDRRNFEVAVQAGGVSVPDVCESVRFPATRDCLKSYGGSEVDWVIDPNSGDWAFSRDGETMIFSGRCLAR